MSRPSRPDPRLLVPCGALSFLPDGARVWEGELPFVWEAASCPPSSTDLLDLSAPTLRDLVPERLDVLPWVLLALARRHRWVGTPTCVSRVEHHGRPGQVVRVLDAVGGTVCALVQHEVPVWHKLRDYPAHVRVHDFPSLDGLEHGSVSRAVVAAFARQPCSP